MKKYIVTVIQEIEVEYVVYADCEQDACTEVERLDCDKYDNFVEVLNSDITYCEEVESEERDLESASMEGD